MVQNGMEQNSGKAKPDLDNESKILKRKLENLEKRVAYIEKALEATRNPIFLKKKA